MNTKQFGSFRILAAGLVLATAATLAAQPVPPGPQDQPPRQGQGRQAPPRDFGPDGPGHMRRMAPGQMGAPGLMRLFSVLTPEQRASVRELMQENREKSKETEEQLIKARKQLIERSLDEEFDEKAVRKQARALAELEADRMVQMAKVLSKVEPPLTDDQKRQLQEPPPFPADEGRQMWRDRRFGPGQDAPPPQRPPHPREPRPPEDR